MDVTLKQKIEEALRRACAPQDATIDLDEDAGRMGGIVLSSRFAGMAPSARQDLIWDQLDLALTPSEQTQISFIITDTSEEHEALAESRPDSRPASD